MDPFVAEIRAAQKRQWFELVILMFLLSVMCLTSYSLGRQSVELERTNLVDTDK